MCSKSSLSLHTNCLISPKLDLLRLIPIHFIYLLLFIQQPSIPRQDSCKYDYFWEHHPATSFPTPQNPNPEGSNPKMILDLNVHRLFLKELCCFYLHFLSQSPVLGCSWVTCTSWQGLGMFCSLSSCPQAIKST